MFELRLLLARAVAVLVLTSLVCCAGDGESKDKHADSSDFQWHSHVHEVPDETGSVTFNVTLDAVLLEESKYFLGLLFDKYGDNVGLDVQALAVMMKQMLCPKPQEKEEHDHSHRKRSVERHTHTHSSHKECLSLNELLEAFHLQKSHMLNAEQFSFICPALVYQLQSDVCNPYHSHSAADQKDGSSKSNENDGLKVETPTSFNLSLISGKVWGFSCVAVLIISLVGLLGVAVIPIMQKVFYNHLLQFLVALAVGALTGDALLHLLPHAFIAGMEHEENAGAAKEEHDHIATAWKGLAALGGIVFFFIMERLLTIITVIKRNRKSKKHTKKKRCEQYCAIESDQKSVGAKLSREQHSDERCDRTVMMVHPNKALKSYADAAHDELMHQCDEEAKTPDLEISIDLPRREGLSEMDTDDGAEKELMELSVSDFKNGHSHGSHGHAHSVPTSVSAVAWMVILGDGLHNFSDGLAIGAAFANSITGGFSTSVAVFCHELPHEIGDFAVLLRAGMSAKQAILYNCLSSILCFVGMLIGVAIGNLSTVSFWIFAVVGGMFLYIALVDMLPEMSSVDPKKGENPFLHLLLQVFGMLSGSSIMLVIALFEHDIKKALG